MPTKSAPNYVVWEYFQSLRLLVENARQAPSPELCRRAAALAVIMAVTGVEVFLNLWLRVRVAQGEVLGDRETLFKELSKRVHLGHKLSQWPQRFLSAALDLKAGPGGAFADVYRCTEAGKTVYSDRPCQGGTAATVAVPSRNADPPAVNPQSEANMGRLVVGQTPLQVEMAWGRPKAKNVDTGSSGRTEQWVYERPDGTTYVYFRSGLSTRKAPVRPRASTSRLRLR